MKHSIFPFLPASLAPEADTVGCEMLAAVGAYLRHFGQADATYAEALPDTPAWFARFTLKPGQTLADLLAAARRTSSDPLPGLDPPAGFPALVVPGHFSRLDPRPWAGVIYGRDLDGWEIVGAWRCRDRFAGAWNRLTGAWADPAAAFAVRFAENESRYRLRKGDGFRVELAEGFRRTSVAFQLVSDCGDTVLIQNDDARVGVAQAFGYQLRGPFGCECWRHTDGSEDCPECGKASTAFIGEASDHIETVAATGIRARDPGYFDPPDPPRGMMPGCTLPDEPRAENE